MLFDLQPAELIARAIVLIIAFTVHEFAHAFVADYFGDDTPRSQGRLTLNPLVHLDPIGSLLLLVAGFGWAKPVQVNPYVLERRSPAAPMLVALAGPVSNLMLASLAAIPLRLGVLSSNFQFAQSGIFPSLSYVVVIFVLFNLILMLFNLLPIFPLDGEKVLHYFLPPYGQSFLDNLRPYGSLILIAVVFLLPSVLQNIIFQPAIRIFTLLVS
jgi:Zn-dependent protease